MRLVTISEREAGFEVSKHVLLAVLLKGSINTLLESDAFSRDGRLGLVFSEEFSAALVSAGNLSCFANVRYAIVQQMQVQVARYASAAAAPYAMISLLSAFASRSIPFDTFGTQLPAPGILLARPAKRSCTVLGYLHTRAAATQTPLKTSW